MTDFVAGCDSFNASPATDQGIWKRAGSNWVHTLLGIHRTDIMDLKRIPDNRLYANSDDVNEYYHSIDKGDSWIPGSSSQGGATAASGFPNGVDEDGVIYDEKFVGTLATDRRSMIKSTDGGLTFTGLYAYVHPTFQVAPSWASRGNLWWCESTYNTGPGATGATEPTWFGLGPVISYVQDNNILWQGTSIGDMGLGGWPGPGMSLAVGYQIQVLNPASHDIVVFTVVRSGGSQSALIRNQIHLSSLPNAGTWSVRGLYGSDTVWVWQWDTHVVNTSILLKYKNSTLTQIAIPSMIGGLYSVVPITDDILYIADTKTSNTSRVYRTTDGGVTWTMILNDTRALPSPGVTTGPYFMDRVNNECILIAKGGVFKSTDGGTTWTFVDGPSTTIEFLDVQFTDSGRRKLPQVTLIGAT